MLFENTNIILLGTFDDADFAYKKNLASACLIFIHRGRWIDEKLLFFYSSNKYRAFLSACVEAFERTEHLYSNLPLYFLSGSSYLTAVLKTLGDKSLKREAIFGEKNSDLIFRLFDLTTNRKFSVEKVDYDKQFETMWIPYSEEKAEAFFHSKTSKGKYLEPKILSCTVQKHPLKLEACFEKINSLPLLER